MIKTDADDVACRKIKAYSFGTKYSQLSKLSAQQTLSIARRRLFYTRTIERFESRFEYYLWQSEKEHLAQLLHLKVERPVRNEDANRDASLFPQRARDSAKVAHSDEREVRDDPRSDAARENGVITRYRTEAAQEKDDSEVDDNQDRETEEALKWLGDEWESLTRVLKRTDLGIHWEDVY